MRDQREVHRQESSLAAADPMDGRGENGPRELGEDARARRGDRGGLDGRRVG